jgi:hypothetical protein
MSLSGLKSHCPGLDILRFRIASAFAFSLQGLQFR